MVVLWLTWPAVLVPVIVTAVGTTAELGGGGGGGGGVELGLLLQPATPRNAAKTKQAAAMPQRRFPRRSAKKNTRTVSRPANVNRTGARQTPKMLGPADGGTAPEAAVWIVSVVVPLVLTGDALKLHVAPFGRLPHDEAENVTVSEKLFTGTIVSVVVPDWPAVTLIAAGDAEITKSAAPPLPTLHSFTRL